MPDPGTPIEGCTHKAPHVHGEPRSVNAGCCRCNTCMGARRAYDRGRQNAKKGTVEKVPAHITRAHVLELVGSGSTVRRIARESGVDADTVTRIKVGRSKLVTRAVHDLILAVPPAVGTVEGRVPATATIRRLRHLALMGWPGEEVARVAGLHVRHIGHIRSGLFHEVRDETAAAVEAATRHLVNRTPPPSRHTTRVRNDAHRKGWVSMFAYDDLDNPDETPNVTPITLGRYAQAEARLDELDHLINGGTPIEEAAHRAGYPTVSAAYEAARHKGRTTLVQRILGEAA